MNGPKYIFKYGQSKKKYKIKKHIIDPKKNVENYNIEIPLNTVIKYIKTKN